MTSICVAKQFEVWHLTDSAFVQAKCGLLLCGSTIMLTTSLDDLEMCKGCVRPE